MKILKHIKNRRAINGGLRLIPMVAKLVLTLCMGKYLTLSEMGIYGLVFGAVMFLGPLVGQGTGYIVVREIVGLDTDVAFLRIRDQTSLYLLNHIAIYIFFETAMHIFKVPISEKIILFIVALTALESLGTATYYCMNSFNQQILANIIFGIRSGYWVIPVVLLWALTPNSRTVYTVLYCWTCGGAMSLAMTAMVWRNMPWRIVFRQKIDIKWMVSSLRRSYLVWLGAVGLAGGTYIDRFAVEKYLTLEQVGVLTFYSSFTNALVALMQSGVLAFTAPLLIKLHQNKDIKLFRDEAKKSYIEVMLSSGIISILLGFSVPPIAKELGRLEIYDNSKLFWLMLAGAFIRSMAEVLYNILYAKHNDRAIWLGNLIFLIPALGGNVILIPYTGIFGAGISAIISSVFLYAWRSASIARQKLESC